MKLRVLIAVTHLLGVGHLARAAAIARGLARAGHHVTLISGGAPAPLVSLDGVRLIQLPPVHIKGTAFSCLFGDDDAPLSEKSRLERKRIMAEAVIHDQPDVIVTELFPFGRRMLSDEFNMLIEASRSLKPRPAIVCSIRDVLVAPLQVKRIKEAHDRILATYDGIMVHGDDNILSLERSWPVSDDIKPLLHYTGYIDEDAPLSFDVSEKDGGEIIVSGGGSASSLPLYQAAIEASAIITDHQWRILIGRSVDDAAFNNLQVSAPSHVIVERARSDFTSLLAKAALSVSQAGYNTVLDLLRARVRAVVVPFEAGNETEQRLRADSLAEAGIWPFAVLPESELSARTLAETISRTLQSEIPSGSPIKRDGISESVAYIEQLAFKRQAPDSPLTRALNDVLAAGQKVRLWWRDDDAIAPTPALEKLLALSEKHALPVAMACIPALASKALCERLAQAPHASVLVHGLAHTNHAPAGQKKAEFGDHRPLSMLMDDAKEGLRLARHCFGDALMPVFVPPWNRISDKLAGQLGDLGYCGLSVAGQVKSYHDLQVANTHIDPIAWHDGGGLLLPSEIETRAAAFILASLNDPKPIVLGLLTHHLVQDEATWDYINNLLTWLINHPAVEVVEASALFRNEEMHSVV